MLSLILPRQVAGRDLADLMVDRLGPLKGQVVRLDARETVHASPSFASQCVKRILVQGAARRLQVDGGSQRFVEQLRDSAQALNVADRLRVDEPAEATA